MVLTWNSERWLEQALPSVTAAAEPVGAEVWIVENGDPTLTSRLLASWPTVQLIEVGCNKALEAYNDAVGACESDIVVTLNDDVVVEPQFLVPLLRHFVETDDLLAVTPDIRRFPPGSLESQGEATGVSWRLGALRPGAKRSGVAPARILYGCGGATAWCRRKFIALGGFDSLYFPGYWEDVDLSWRGWKRGWRCLYDPSSVVYHAGGGSFDRTDHKVRTLQVRNEFLFHWKNLDPPFLGVHMVLLPFRLLNAVRRRDRARLRGFFAALRRTPRVWKQRAAVRPSFKKADRELLELIG